MFHISVPMYISRVPNWKVQPYTEWHPTKKGVVRLSGNLFQGCVKTKYNNILFPPYILSYFYYLLLRNIEEDFKQRGLKWKHFGWKLFKSLKISNFHPLNCDRDEINQTYSKKVGAISYSEKLNHYWKRWVAPWGKKHCAGK